MSSPATTTSTLRESLGRQIDEITTAYDDSFIEVATGEEREQLRQQLIRETIDHHIQAVLDGITSGGLSQAQLDIESEKARRLRERRTWIFNAIDPLPWRANVCAALANRLCHSTGRMPVDQLNRFAAVMSWLRCWIPLHTHAYQNQLVMHTFDMMVNMDEEREQNFREAFKDDLRIHPFPTSFPLTVQAVDVLRYPLATDIFDSWGSLRTIYMTHRMEIISKWKAKSRSVREKILKAAWKQTAEEHNNRYFNEIRWNESLNHYHRMDIETCILKRPNEGKYDLLRWGFINREDLLNMNNELLLNMFNDRAFTMPSAFYGADCSSCELDEMRYVRAWSSDFGMEFLDQNTAAWYGNVVPADQMGEGGCMTATKGLVTMEIQSRLYAFLVKCCMGIMEQSEADLIAPSPDGIPVVANDTIIRSLSAAPQYRIINRLQDFDALLPLIDARRNAAIDHVFLLRNDPGYVYETIREITAHMYYIIIWEGTDYEVAEVRKTAIITMIHAAFLNLGAWQGYYRRFSNLRNLLRRHYNQYTEGGTADDNQALGGDIQASILRLGAQLENDMDLFRRALWQAVPASSPFKGKVRVRQPTIPDEYAPPLNEEDSSATWHFTVVNPKSDKDLALQYIFESCKFIRQTVGYANAGDILREFVWRSGDRKKAIETNRLLTGYVKAIMSDFVLMTQCMDQIERHQGENGSLIFREFEGETPVDLLDLQTQDWIDGHAVDEIRNDEDVVAAADYFFTERHYENDILQQELGTANGLMWRFWRVVDREILDPAKNVVTGYSAVQFEQLRRRRSAQRKSNKRAHSQLESIEESEEEEGVAHVEQVTPGGSGDGPPRNKRARLDEVVVEPTRLEVKNKTLKVVAMLYSPKPGDTSTLPWTQFCDAMHNMGFQSSQVRDTTYQFRPPGGLTNTAPINFERPHPGGDLNFVKLQEIRQRLSLQYGLVAENFVRRRHGNVAKEALSKARERLTLKK
ncbi:hypothetical protein N7478_011642 [Penicillium angulare]|uniref:uncharacterized protein n=1 Tax=Penicillium angulare TaxID=116970 RepID=UPI0025409983|nr:uncharacterized protein N7478_011642 [Penicillium angulare]KAJ5261047.1 hypothetical protein N7478_011642 [Penicillium angulare]